MLRKEGVRLDRCMVLSDCEWGVVDGKQIRSVCAPLYATPEHLKDEIPTIASDIYQSGIILYQILTGQLPFYVPGDKYDEAIINGRKERNESTPLTEIQTVVPEWASSTVMSMLAWNANDRPDVEEVIAIWDKNTSV